MHVSLIRNSYNVCFKKTVTHLLLYSWIVHFLKHKFKNFFICIKFHLSILEQFEYEILKTTDYRFVVLPLCSQYGNIFWIRMSMQEYLLCLVTFFVFELYFIDTLSESILFNCGNAVIGLNHGGLNSSKSMTADNLTWSFCSSWNGNPNESGVCMLCSYVDVLKNPKRPGGFGGRRIYVYITVS